MNRQALFIGLKEILGLNLAKYKQLLQIYEKIEDAIDDDFKLVETGIKNFNFLKKWTNKSDFENQAKKLTEVLEKNEVKVLDFENNYYEVFSNLADSPLCLYYKGKIDILTRNPRLTVVGSRNYTKYAERAITEILSELVTSGLVTVSGLAVGIDGLVHKLSLKLKQPTIGVIGSGLDKSSFYPRENYRVYEEIVETQGLVLSEYFVNTLPKPYHFPLRNRLLASLSSVTWVVQASLKSGSLITAKQALEQNKTVATIPGSIFESGFSGNIKLIQDGAQIIASKEDLETLLGISRVKKIDFITEVKIESEIGEKIYTKLELLPQSNEQLATALNLSIETLSAELSMLELQGLAVSVGNNEWVRG